MPNTATQKPTHIVQELNLGRRWVLRKSSPPRDARSVVSIMRFYALALHERYPNVISLSALYASILLYYVYNICGIIVIAQYLTHYAGAGPCHTQRAHYRLVYCGLRKTYGPMQYAFLVGKNQFRFSVITLTVPLCKRPARTLYSHYYKVVNLKPTCRTVSCAPGVRGSAPTCCRPVHRPRPSTARWSACLRVR